MSLVGAAPAATTTSLCDHLIEAGDSGAAILPLHHTAHSRVSLSGLPRANNRTASRHAWTDPGISGRIYQQLRNVRSLR